MTEDIGMGSALAGLANRGYTPRVVYDIGAADGGWTRFAHSIWPHAHFICFEPLAERHQSLESLKNDLDADLHFVGIADSDTNLSLGVTKTLWESSFAYGGDESRQVPVRSLTSMYDEGLLRAPNFIKIDIQGFERKAIIGGGELVKSADFFLIECSFRKFCADMSTIDQMIIFMSHLGFIPYEFVDFLRRPLDGAMGQCDILFANRSHDLVQDNRWA